MYQTQFQPQAQFCNPYMQPQQVNAVKIDVIHPQAYGGVNSDGQVNPQMPAYQNSMYSYPYAPMYNLPVAQQYNTPGVYPQPVLPQYAMPQQQMVQTLPLVSPVPQIQQTVPVTNPIAQVTPQPAPVLNTPPVPPVPVVPVENNVAEQPVATQPTISAPVTQQVNIAPQSIPAAVVDNTNNTKVEPVQPVQQQAETKAVDVNGLLRGLASTNPEEQTVAIQKIAEVAQTDPVAAKGLLNEQVFGQLVNVINADTSKLQGPTGEANPKSLSPLEKAEINKQFAVYTLAILQKNFREEINKEMKKNNLPDIAINDLPYIKEGIVNNLKDNQNPTIREACLSALNYVGRPEDKEVLKTLYDISAKHDKNPSVQAAAKEYLAKLPA